MTMEGKIMEDIAKKIIAQLSQEAADAESAGHDSISFDFTPYGEILDDTTENGYLGEGYFDRSDPDDPCWVYWITPIVNGEIDLANHITGELVQEER